MKLRHILYAKLHIDSHVNVYVSVLLSYLSQGTRLINAFITVAPLHRYVIDEVL